jgi:hypothetical protein
MTSLLCTGRSHPIHGQRSTGVAGLVRAFTYLRVFRIDIDTVSRFQDGNASAF